MPASNAGEPIFVFKMGGRCSVRQREARPFVRLHAVVVLLSLLQVAAAFAAPPYRFEKPEFLAEPEVAKTLMGATYAYMPQSISSARRLMITTMPAEEVRRQLGSLSAVQCVNLFLKELRAEHERFFVVSQKRPLTVGAREFVQFRWTGDKADKTLTGVLSCGTIDGVYYVVHFVDELLDATQSFPKIRASLKTLATRTP